MMIRAPADLGCFCHWTGCHLSGGGLLLRDEAQIQKRRGKLHVSTKEYFLLCLFCGVLASFYADFTAPC